jgi:hypothetical protein
MDRAEATGLGVAVAAHGALLYALSLSLADNRLPPVRSDPILVSFVGAVAPVSAAPTPSVEAPAPSPAAAAAEPIPEEARPLPPPQPASLAPQASPRKPEPAGPQPRPDQRRTDRTRTGRLTDITKGLSDGESDGRPDARPAAAMSAQAAAGIAGLIRRQVQPCANRMVSPGPGANRIKVTISLRLDRDGSLATPPRVIGSSGLDDENRRYLQRVKELAVSAFTSCAPLRGLPAELYAVPNGWNDFDMIYNLP